MTTENTNENESYQAPIVEEESELSDEELNAVAGGAGMTAQTTTQDIFTAQTTTKNIFTA